jgi:hypothetical protein
MKIELSVDKVEITSGFHYNSNEACDYIAIEFAGVINSPLKRLDDSLVLSSDTSGELTNKPNSENHFMVSVEESVRNSIGYLSISKSWSNDTEYSSSIYLKPNNETLAMILNSPDNAYILTLSAVNEQSEATAFSVPRDTGKLLMLEIESEIIIPIYRVTVTYEKN